MRVKTRNFAAFPAVESLENRLHLAAQPAAVGLTAGFAGRLPGVLPVAAENRVVIRETSTGRAAAAGTVTVNLFASTNTTLDSGDFLLGSATQPVKLGRGRSANVPVDFATPTTLADGNYFLIAQVDNTGNQTVKTGFTVSYYLSADSVLDSGDPLLAETRVAPVTLRPSQGKGISLRLAVPPGTAVGGYFLFAVVTPSSSTVDSVVNNDVAISGRRVAVVTRIPQQPIFNYSVVIYYTGPDYYYDQSGDYGYYTDAVDTGTGGGATAGGPSDGGGATTGDSGVGSSATTQPADGSNGGATTQPTTQPAADPTTQPADDPTTQPADPTDAAPGGGDSSSPPASGGDSSDVNSGGQGAGDSSSGSDSSNSSDGDSSDSSGGDSSDDGGDDSSCGVRTMRVTSRSTASGTSKAVGVLTIGTCGVSGGVGTIF